MFGDKRLGLTVLILIVVGMTIVGCGKDAPLSPEERFLNQGEAKTALLRSQNHRICHRREMNMKWISSRNWATLLMVAGIVLLPGPGTAQSTVSPGVTKVSVTTFGASKSFEGVLLEKSAGSLKLLDEHGKLIEIKSSSVMVFRMWVSSKSHGKQGAWMGALAGMVGGALLTINEGELGQSAGMGIGMMGGAAVGAILGFTRRSGGWQEVSLDRIQLGMSQGPAKGVLLSAKVLF